MATSGLLDSAINSIDVTLRSLDDQALRIVAEIQDKITDLNKDQLMQGLDGTGQKLKPKYSRVRYARAKNSVNPLPGYGTPDLKLTGKYYTSLYVVANNDNTFEINSDRTEKGFDLAGHLEEKYGENHLLLTKENEDKINFEEIYPKLLEWILSQLQL